ncbi:hypothetical protein RchiOBHm_Chr2g0154171 [Rosa chinensis]|uniref:Secreted protein n=1 Tax=Rosa chinensis TaxID=74649 RepID=A0A2P6S0W0_ROSCH|nr:hypothetical protein RchiOBHm_Chr2g0154171 [Rosa chinensis]
MILLSLVLLLLVLPFWKCAPPTIPGSHVSGNKSLPDARLICNECISWTLERMLSKMMMMMEVVGSYGDAVVGIEQPWQSLRTLYQTSFF